MNKPILLDTFCKAGGCTKGYQRAGFYVIGVDIEPQPRYCGDDFIQADALEFIAHHGSQFDAIHASPECEGYSSLTPKKYRSNHPLQIGDVRALLQATGKPYVIENVKGARKHLRNPLMLCGSMFDLPIFRHRYFEISGFEITFTAPCCHNFKPIPINSSSVQRTANTAECAYGLKIDWMIREEMRKAIPPAYTEFLGKHLMQAVNTKVVAHDR